MRVSITKAIFIILLLTAISCGGDSETESSHSFTDDISTDTLQAEVHETVDEEELLREIEANVPVASGPEGSWDTTMGHMQLVVDDTGNVTGDYPLGSIEGTLTGDILEFTYYEGTLSGEGTFTFADGFNSFSGAQDISGTEFVWDGTRLQII